MQMLRNHPVLVSGAEKIKAMDGKVQVEVLRKHSEHVGKLVTQLTGKLTHLAHVLSAPQVLQTRRPPASARSVPS